jgi:hypothetical protein
MTNRSPFKLARSTYYVCLSLSLLLVTYMVLGWFIGLHQSNWVPKIWQSIPQAEWIISVVGMVLVSALVTAPFARVRRWILAILNVDDWLFMVCLGMSLVMVFFFVHMDVVVKLIVLAAALLLARFDLINLRWSGWSAFVVLSLVGTIGLGMGGLGHWATVRYDVHPWSNSEKTLLQRLERRGDRLHREAGKEHEANSAEAESREPKSTESKSSESKSSESKSSESTSDHAKSNTKSSEPKSEEARKHSEQQDEDAGQHSKLNSIKEPKSD